MTGGTVLRALRALRERLVGVGDGGVPAAPRHPPRVEVDLGPTLPGALVRVLPAVLVAVLGLLLAGHEVVWAALGAVAVLATVRPGWLVGPPLVLLVGLLVLVGPDALAVGGGGAGAGGGEGAGAAGGAAVDVVGAARLAAVLAVLDLTLRAVALAVHTPWRSRVEWAVAGRVGRSVLTTQLVLQPALLLTLGVRAVTGGGLPGGAGDGWDAAGLVRVVTLVVAGVLLTSVIGRRVAHGRPAR
ncbi:hypothetical protein [Cellulomonas sp. ATA003]|uniref:hypothetical protein n=1 Tax=Cellulomonas sp. ATA003 TaxID=3073064 RepID=UPI002872FAF9|nr:hypothetical protein [Cellulomonas sp. ATA003]WNB85810.1 hypothetical protein REH70_00175 [Cellulomonas sp. ATA003]